MAGRLLFCLPRRSIEKTNEGRWNDDRIDRAYIDDR